MTIEEFQQETDYADKIKAFARLCMDITATDYVNSIGSEYIWLNVDENDKLTEVTYAYTLDNDDGTKKFVHERRYALSGIDLKEIAAGKGKEFLQYEFKAMQTEHDFAFKSAEQGSRGELADALFDYFLTNESSKVTQQTPLLRLISLSPLNGGQYSLDMYDVVETGYIYYSLNVTAAAAADDDALIAAVNAATSTNVHKVTVTTGKGTLIYQNKTDTGVTVAPTD